MCDENPHGFSQKDLAACFHSCIDSGKDGTIEQVKMYLTCWGGGDWSGVQQDRSTLDYVVTVYSLTVHHEVK